MRKTNKESYNDLFCWLKVFACSFVIAHFGCKAFCNEIVIYELDPTYLLTTYSEHRRAGDEELSLPDIQMPPYINWPDLNAPSQTNNLAVNFTTAVKDTPSQSTPSPSDVPVVQLERKLWKNRVSPLDQRPDNNKPDELKQIIEQIRSIQFEPQERLHQPAETAITKTPEPNTTPILEPAAHTQSETSAKSTSDRTLKAVEELLKDPSHITNPFELAEVLFRSGRPGPAGLCYKQALASIAADDPNMASERAWILFQIGNCLKNDDPNTSKESYAELIRTHPGSPWAEIARSRHGLVDWYQQNQPDKLIQELNR